jgi:two-component system, NarL family, nitrate/nitrite response regulator NarL
MVRRLRVAPITGERDFSPSQRTADASRETRGLTVVSQRAFGEGAGQTSAQQAPDVVLLDISKPGDASEAAKSIARASPGVRTITLSFPESERYVAHALAAAAKAYLPSGTNGEDILNAILAVSRGASYVMVGVPARLLMEASRKQPPPQTSAPAPGLTEREVQILTEVSRGLTNKEIARNLALSEKTIKNCMTHIMQKLKVRNRVEAVLFVQAERTVRVGR